MAAEGQSDKTSSDMEICMKQECVSEFFHAQKMAPTEIHLMLAEHLQRPVYMSTVVGDMFQQ